MLFALGAEGGRTKLVELYARVRYAVRVEGLNHREAARPKLDPFVGVIDQILEKGFVRLAGSVGPWQLGWHDDGTNPYRGFRYPAEVIQHAVWLHHCFSLSLRDVEAILAPRGVVVSYESIREWGLRFGWLLANTLKRLRPKPGDKWFLDEVFLRIRGKLHPFEERWTSMEACLTSWCRASATLARPSASSASCRTGYNRSRVSAILTDG